MEQEPGSTLREAGLDLMVAMVMADGVVDEREIAAVVKASVVLPGGRVEPDDVRARLEAPPVEPLALLESVAPSLSEGERVRLFNAALGVASADGVLADGEKLLLLAMGERLGLDVLEALAELFPS